MKQTKTYSHDLAKNRRFLVSILFYFVLIISIKGQPSFCISNPAGSQSVTVDIMVEDFTDIIAFQFSMQWNPSILEFDSVGNFGLPLSTNFGNTNFGTAPANHGRLVISWLDDFLNGNTLPDGTTLFSITFNVLEMQSTPIFITNNPVSIMIADWTSNGIGYYFDEDIIIKNGMVNGKGVILHGNIFEDENMDCAFNSGEQGLEGMIVKVENSTKTYHASTNDAGDYSIFLDTGNYVVTPILPNNYWQLCAASYAVDLEETMDSLELEIPFQKLINCPAMEVDISAPILRRCFSNNKYVVNYCNKGTYVGEGAFVEITFDPYLTVLSSTLPWTSQNGNTYTFDLGDVDYGDCGSFEVDINVSCDAPLGITHCTEAHIYPDDFCDPPNTQWSGASLVVNGACNVTNDSLIFTIENLGVGDMLESSNYSVIENAIMLNDPHPFQLSSGTTETIVIPANGSTFRMEVDQVAFHPGNSMPSATVEGCGTNAGGGFSIGFMNQFSLDEGDPFVSIDCQENVGAFDPNDKQAFPKGYGNQNYIEPNTDIEYLIRFQNTGTDTAFNVVIRDTLSEFLNPTTISLGASSHPYDFQLTDAGVAIFEFENILLPDSVVNEPASHGFVKFKISQKTDVPLESMIHNSAAIYFDFNAPIITNTVSHTIGKHFITVSTEKVFVPNLTVLTYPNPFSEMVQFEIKGEKFETIELKLFDLTGSLLRNATYSNNSFTFYRNGLSSGMYTYILMGDGQILSSGKIVVE